MTEASGRPYQKPRPNHARPYRVPALDNIKKNGSATNASAVETEVSSPAPGSGPNYSVLKGIIERITFQSDETGYTVARLQPEKARADELVTVVGTLPSVNPGENLELKGWWKSHPTYGRQFQVDTYTVLLPATITGIQKYLGSGLIKGIGPKTSTRIVDHFGLETLNILENSPIRLVEVPSLGRKRADMIMKAWQEQKAIKEVMVFLQGQGISTALAVRIYKTYGDASISVVKNEPYKLADDVFGIGFKTADKIAASLGIPKDSPERLKSGLKFTLSEATDEGHVFLPREELVKRSAELLEATPEQVEEALDALQEERGVETERLHKLDDLPPLGQPVRERSATSAEEEAIGRQVREEKAPYLFDEPDDISEADPWDLPAADTRFEAVYLTPFHRAEMGISGELLRLKTAPPSKDRLSSFKMVSFDVVFDYLSNKESLTLNERQRDAVRLALTDKVSVLTGGPGTGKTTSMRALLRVLAVKKKKVILAAPTGRAAKRLSETTGAPATTIHRLLELRPGGKAAYDRDNRLDADMVIVDEASMLDVLLMNNLVKAVPNGAHLLLVGDTDQLPSVGAGNVLADVVNSQVVPVVRLDHIFRQGAGSAIVTNAHRINQGEFPLIGKEITDFFFFVEDDSEKCAEMVVELVAERIPRKFGFDSIKDIQVLAPMHRTAAGVANLNTILQEKLNPAGDRKPERKWGGKHFRVGDKVMQLKNNYDKQVFNGDGGLITGIDGVDQLVTVKLEDGRLVEYDFAELDELTLAYAVSVHKSQGSEYPVVVLPLVTGHFQMLQRNLVYTAVTRARKLVVLVGSKRALGMAVRNNKQSKRYSGLATRLRDFAPTIIKAV
ncbi:MAG TPA: ATP-dependent RecD-like DNA helicase [Chloroflexia bacterium]|nr:ATP-dependent RecD-like DNA helicase [Chloroflexia bacterium]